MSNPINDNRPTGQHTVKPQQLSPSTPMAAGGDSNPDASVRLSEDQVTLSSTAAQQATEPRISTLDAAHRAIEKLRQQIEANPGAVLSAQRGLDTDTATSTLRQAAA